MDVFGCGWEFAKCCFVFFVVGERNVCYVLFFLFVSEELF